jgi:hypothetical protein
MGEQNPYVFGNGKLYINGELLGDGIPDLEYDVYDVAGEYIKENTMLKSTDSTSFEFVVRWDKVLFWKLTGLWDYVIQYCPNRRLAHLVKYGKNRRVRIKNFYRAVAATVRYLLIKERNLKYERNK